MHFDIQKGKIKDVKGGKKIKMCYCKWAEVILAIIIIVLAWPGLINWQYSAWTIVIAGILILIHTLFCRKCKVCNEMEVKTQPRRAKGKRR